MASDTTKYFAKLVGKGLATILLALSASLFAVYAKNHFPGWAFALSLLLVVCASIPAVLFFNLFPSSDAAQRPRKPIHLKERDDDWNDLFSPHRRDDYDPFND